MDKMSVPAVPRVGYRFSYGISEPRDEDLISADSVKELRGNDTIKIKIVTKDGQPVSWIDYHNKKYPVEDLITVMTHQDGSVQIYTEDGKVF